MSDFNLGTVTAYGYAKDKGYTGTEGEFAELMASYASVAESAAASAESAAASATTATTKAGEASTSASNAATSATTASTAATTATTKAGEASTSASTASTKASEATTAAATATTKAGEASTSATNAAGSATTASTAATTATTKASEAAASATAAAQSAASLVIDDTLTHAGQAADAKKVGDEISSLKEDYAQILDSAYVTDTASGSIASFPDGADGVPIKSLTVDIKPVQSGSGDPSPDNVRPISGHTSAVVTRTGFNVWDEEWVNGRWAGNNGVLNTAFTSYVASKNKISVKPNTTYYFTVSGSTAKTREVVFYDANENWLSDAPSVYQDATFTTPSGCYYITFNLGGAYGATYNHDVSINLPNTDHNYHAYSGQTVTIDLDGTRYGGTLDVTTGVLTVTHAYYQFTGNETINGTVDNAHINTSAFPTQMKVGTWYTDAKTLCDCLPKTNVGKGIRFGADNKTIYFYDLQDIVPAITDKTSLDAWIASQKPCITYPIEPVTIQLTANEISTLLGQNNIWSDAGDVEVEYRADTKLYIEKLTAPTEDDMVADHAISSGSFFMVGNTLYRATTAIASGATITVGTNATKLSLSDALNALS